MKSRASQLPHPFGSPTFSSRSDQVFRCEHDTVIWKECASSRVLPCLNTTSASHTVTLVLWAGKHSPTAQHASCTPCGVAYLMYGASREIQQVASFQYHVKDGFTHISICEVPCRWSNRNSKHQHWLWLRPHEWITKNSVNAQGETHHWRKVAGFLHRFCNMPLFS